MKLEQQLLINRNEVRTTTFDQQGMKLEQNYWSTGNEVRAATTDQQGMS